MVGIRIRIVLKDRIRIHIFLRIRNAGVLIACSMLVGKILPRNSAKLLNLPFNKVTGNQLLRGSFIRWAASQNTLRASKEKKQILEEKKV